MQLTSLKNPRVKSVLALEKARERNARGVFAVEGAREIDRAVRSGYETVEVFFCADELSPSARVVLGGLQKVPGVERFEVTRPIFEKLAVREGSDGIVAVMRQKAHRLETLALPAAPLVVAVEDVEKPGNLGALLRSADGAGVDAVVVLGKTVDLYNPNVIRSSLGTVFHVPVVNVSSEELRDYCRVRGLVVHAAALAERSMPYTSSDLTKPSVILLGCEKDGLSEYWQREADVLVKIPMLGIADSLNVATAGGVMMYEARRQRMTAASRDE